MKKFRIIFLVVFLLILSCVCSYAASTTETQCADALYELGLFSGTGTNTDGTPIYSLDRVPTRQEAAAMLVRLLGKDAEAKSTEYSIPFTDVDNWAKPYVGYLYQNGLTSGTSATTFGGNAKVSANQYLTFVLRALGYDDKAGDFTWDKAYKLANKIGISSGEYDSESAFDRGNLVSISYMALKANLKDEDKTLLEELYDEKAVSSNTIADVDVPKYRIEFDELLSDLNTNRYETVKGNLSTETLKNYAQHKVNEVDMTQQEINQLHDTSNMGKETLTHDEAIYDVNLYFKALKYGYGGYYYQGEENFINAQNQILDWIDNKESISSVDLRNIIEDVMSFVQDGHFSPAGRSNVDNGDVDYKYYYCDLCLCKDDHGYYYLDGDTKWYYASCNNLNVEIEPYLNKDGLITYSPRQFCDKKYASEKDILIFTNGNQNKKVTIDWTISTQYKSDNVDYNYFKQNGIAYVSVRSFTNENSETLNKFLSDAYNLKDTKLIIYDIRGNRGGDESYPINWLKNITGSTPSIERIVANWRSCLIGNPAGQIGSESYVFSSTSTKIAQNNIPIIVLVDDNVYSSGESAVMYSRAVDNCIIIGSNTGGAQLFGGNAGFALPNSGIHFSFSFGLQFVYEMKNVDLIGYEPDIWCNAGDALASVINMIEQYDLSSAESVEALISYVEEHTNDYGDDTIYFELAGLGRFTSGLGALSGYRTYNIIYKDKTVTDYTFANSDDSIVTVKKNANGQLVVTQVGNGYSTITIKIGNKTQEFSFRGGE